MLQFSLFTMEKSGEETQKTEIKDEKKKVPGPVFFPSLREELLEVSYVSVCRLYVTSL